MAVVMTSANVKDTDPNYILGLRIYSYFHEASKKYSAYKYKSGTVKDLAKYYGDKGRLQIYGLGKSFKLTEKPESYAKDKMIKLSEVSKGRLPIWQAYRDILFDELTNTNYWVVLKEGVSEAASQVHKGFVSVGDTVLDTGKNIQLVMKWMPFIAVGLGAFIIYKKFTYVKKEGSYDSFKRKASEIGSKIKGKFA
jgi:hypothetical protein